MRLSEYLKREGIQQQALVGRLGLTKSRVSQLCGDEPGWPGKDVMIAIREFTNGEVTADDFLPPREGGE